MCPGTETRKGPEAALESVKIFQQLLNGIMPKYANKIKKTF